MKKTIKGIVLPNDYFLTRDNDGRYHWWSKDPLRAKNKAEIEVQIESIITEVVGFGDIANPVLVHLNCAKVDRSVAFQSGLLANIRRGSEAKHFEDLSGSVIDVLEIQNSDRDFPLTGAVFNEKGDVVSVRKYSFKGDCSDGVEEHKLIAMDGVATFETPQPEGKEGE